jgi:hypothetical protein
MDILKFSIIPEVLDILMLLKNPESLDILQARGLSEVVRFLS